MKGLNVDHLNLVLFAVVIMLIFCCCFKKTREGWKTPGKKNKKACAAFKGDDRYNQCEKGYWPCCKKGSIQSGRNRDFIWYNDGNCDKGYCQSSYNQYRKKKEERERYARLCNTHKHNKKYKGIDSLSCGKQVLGKNPTGTGLKWSGTKCHHTGEHIVQRKGSEHNNRYVGGNIEYGWEFLCRKVDIDELEKL